MDNRLLELLQASGREAPDRDSALYIWRHTGTQEEAGALLAAARAVRRREKGEVFTLSGGIATVLECNLRPLCLYCPYWREAGKRPLSTAEILKAVDYLVAHGVRDFHLSGGTTLGSEGKDILAIVRAIAGQGHPGLTIDVNCGAAMSLATAREMKEYGVVMVRSVFETLDAALFARVKPGDDLEAKKRFAHTIGQAGLALGTGLMAGLPDEENKAENYVDFLMAVKQYPHLRNVYVSKFTPFPSIALKGKPACPDLEAARVIALARLILRDVDIGGAQGWQGSGLTPLDAGGGNSALGIHINRTPAYMDKAKQGPGVVYEDDMEYRNMLDGLAERYAAHGITLAM